VAGQFGTRHAERDPDEADDRRNRSHLGVGDPATSRASGEGVERQTHRAD
jgi:hypothetical protein